jgi:hypothetical protein
MLHPDLECQADEKQDDRDDDGRSKGLKELVDERKDSFNIHDFLLV